MKSDEPIDGLDAKVHRSQYGTAKRIYSIEEKVSGKDRLAVAKAFLKKYASDLGLEHALKGLRYEKERKSLMGYHLMFQQYVNGNPVSGAWMRVDMDKKGRVLGVQNGTIPQDRVRKTVRKAKAGDISRTKAERLALKAVAPTGKVEKIERVMWPVNGIPVDAWKVMVRPERAAALWRLYVAVEDGRVLFKRNMVKRAWAQVFDPTPVAALNNTHLDIDADVPARAYRKVRLQGLKKKGVLDGQFVTTRPTKDRVRSADGHFLFRRTQRAFREVMAYYHLDTAIRYLEGLGFTGLFKRPLKVKVHGTRVDNSWFDTGTRTITFGTGGVDDPEDAEVILHELGHAVQEAQLPGFGESNEGWAMGEGFGDFLAASYFHDKKPARLRDTVFNWNAMPTSEADPPHERRLDAKLKYPDDMAEDEHDNGPIWSACLWELRALLGRRRCERVVIASHHLCERDALFADGAHAILTANERLYNDRGRTAIRTLFERRGIIKPK
ncbi:MAG: M36 family metallopeptidase [Flavobacteriales bacterium]|nr:M36 family metallopeptidase [Flavobacteriales bacterium]